MKLLLLIERGLKAAALLGNGVQQNRTLLGLEELKGLDEQTDVVAVERAVIGEPKLLKEHGGPQHALGGFFRLAHHLPGSLAAEFFQQARRGIVQIGVPLVGDDLVQVIGDRADVAVDRPFVVVQHHDHALGLLGNIVQRLKADAVGERRIPGKGDDVLLGTGQIARHRHAQGGGKRGPSVACAVAVVLAFGAQSKAVQAARLAHGVETAAASGEQFVNVRLVADVKDKAVSRGVEDVVHGQGELDDAQVRPQVAARLGQHTDQLLAYFLSQCLQLRHGKALDVRGRVDRVE